MKNKTFACVAVVIPLLMCVEAQAAIYKCINPQAEVYYNDKPCPVTAIESQMKAVKDPVGGYIPVPFSPSNIAEKGMQKSGKKGLIIGDDITSKDVSSKKETLADQSSDGNSNSSSASTDSENKKSQTEGVNSTIIPGALGDSTNSNTSSASTSSSEMNNQVRVH